jgi:hypothetical protein
LIPPPALNIGKTLNSVDMPAEFAKELSVVKYSPFQ